MRNWWWTCSFIVILLGTLWGGQIIQVQPQLKIYLIIDANGLNFESAQLNCQARAQSLEQPINWQLLKAVQVAKQRWPKIADWQHQTEQGFFTFKLEGPSCQAGSLLGTAHYHSQTLWQYLTWQARQLFN